MDRDMHGFEGSLKVLSIRPAHTAYSLGKLLYKNADGNVINNKNRNIELKSCFFRM